MRQSMRDTGRDVSQEAHTKPTLDAERFQRLLAAAYILQSRSDWTPAEPIISADAKSFAARALVQKRTPSIRPSVARSDAMSEANAVPKLVGVMFWKKVEALAIAIVFCLMMGISVHRLLVFPGRTSSPSGILEPRDASTPAKSTPTVLTSAQQPAATHASRLSRGDFEGDAFGDDLVILYHAPAINLSGHAEKGTTTGTEPLPGLSRKNTILETGMRIATRQEAGMLAESAVQYGDDVTMWSSERSKKSVLNREAR